MQDTFFVRKGGNGNFSGTVCKAPSPPTVRREVGKYLQLVLGGQGLPSAQLPLEALNFPRRHRTNTVQLWKKTGTSQLLQLEGEAEVIQPNVPSHHEKSP